jgi:hypothetical protein
MGNICTVLYVIHCLYRKLNAASTYLQVWQPVRVLCVNLRRLLAGIVSSEYRIGEYPLDVAGDTNSFQTGRE